MPALLRLLLTGHRLAGENHFLLLLIHSDHPDLDLFADPGLYILHIIRGKLGCGNKGSHTLQVGNHTALDALFDANLHNGFLIQHRLQLIPRKDIVRLFLRKFDIALPVIHPDHRSLDLVPHGNLAGRQKIRIVT